MEPTNQRALAQPINIILVDDHRLFRDGLRQLLGADPRFEVAGEAASGEEFLELLTETLYADVLRSQNPPRPLPLVFMDIDMPGMGGVEATRRALERHPDLKIVALSMHGEREFHGPMVEAGARGFLLKDSDFAQVADAIETVVSGETWFALDPDPEPGSGRVELHEVEPLSERETEVLPLVCKGLSNHEIAERLFISKRTVDKHRANILAKTGCRNTASLVIHAVKHNLIKI
jgi:DNA-binding NarL/FixJ family response regulator